MTAGGEPRSEQLRAGAAAEEAAALEVRTPFSAPGSGGPNGPRGCLEKSWKRSRTNSLAHPGAGQRPRAFFSPGTAGAPGLWRSVFRRDLRRPEEPRPVTRPPSTSPSSARPLALGQRRREPDRPPPSGSSQPRPGIRLLRPARPASGRGAQQSPGARTAGGPESPGRRELPPGG